MYHIASTAAGIQAVVFNQGLNGTMDGQLHERCAPLLFLFCLVFLPYCVSKPRGSPVAGLSIPVQTQGEESWSSAGGTEGSKREKQTQIERKQEGAGECRRCGAISLESRSAF